jgi:hypothetical protein
VGVHRRAREVEVRKMGGNTARGSRSVLLVSLKECLQACMLTASEALVSNCLRCTNRKFVSNPTRKTVIAIGLRFGGRWTSSLHGWNGKSWKA